MNKQGRPYAVIDHYSVYTSLTVASETPNKKTSFSEFWRTTFNQSLKAELQLLPFVVFWLVGDVSMRNWQPIIRYSDNSLCNFVRHLNSNRILVLTLNVKGFTDWVTLGASWYHPVFQEVYRQESGTFTEIIRLCSFCYRRGVIAWANPGKEMGRKKNNRGKGRKKGKGRKERWKSLILWKFEGFWHIVNLKMWVPPRLLYPLDPTFVTPIDLPWRRPCILMVSNQLLKVQLSF